MDLSIGTSCRTQNSIVEPIGLLNLYKLCRRRKVTVFWRPTALCKSESHRHQLLACANCRDFSPADTTDFSRWSFNFNLVKGSEFSPADTTDFSRVELQF